MFYLAIQTLLWIVLAVVFGIFVGWLLWKPSSKSIQIELENLHRKISNREKKIISLRRDLDQCRASLNDFKADVENDCRPNLVTQLPDPVRPTGAYEVDDLKQISGVGPDLEGKLNALNIYTYRQMAALTPEVIGELADTLGSISHRIVQEDWVGQAKQMLKSRAKQNSDLPAD